MTAKAKAIQLVNSFDELGRDFTRGVSMKEFSKQCALIAVEEILIQLMFENESNYEYWQEVKKEIEKTL
jgi:hypothetical protein